MPELKLVNLACMPHAAGECMRSACALDAMGHAPTYVGCDCIYALWLSVYVFTALGGRAYGSRCSLVRVAKHSMRVYALWLTVYAFTAL